MYKVGITGGIGSGKSSVCDILAEFGVAVYDSDFRAKRLMNEDNTLREHLVERFGCEVYCVEGLNRIFLAERVFGNPDELKALNAFVHPAVLDDFDRWALEQEGSYVVLESAILFEASLDRRVDVSVAVMAPEELRIERAMQRDGAQREQIVARMNNQISDQERVERAKYTIVNIDIDNLRSDVEQLHRRLSYVAQAQRN